MDIEQLAVALRLTDGGAVPEPLAGELDRLLKASRCIIKACAGNDNIPDPIREEAVTRIANYLYSMPDAPMTDKYADIVRNSGADILIRPYRYVGVATIE